MNPDLYGRAVAQLLKRLFLIPSIYKTKHMKRPTKQLAVQSLFLLFFFCLFNFSAMAQGDKSGGGSSENSSTTTTEKKTSLSVNANDNTGNTTWYASPWVWVVGAAVFILLLVALLSNRGRDTVSTTDRVKVTKTVERDSGSAV